MMITNNHHYSENQKLKGIFIDSKKNIIYKKNKYINSGYYFFSKSIYNLINNKTLSIEDEVIPFLIKKKRIIGIINNEKLIDIGTPKNLFNSKRISISRRKI